MKLAAETIGSDEIVRLRAMVAEIADGLPPADYQRKLMAVRLAVGDASGNPALALFMRVLVRVLTHLVWRNMPPATKVTPVLRETRGHIAEMVEAIVAGDASLAHQIVRQNVGVRSQSFHSEMQLIKRAKPAARPRGETGAHVPESKAADRVARAIVDDIRGHGWRPGDRLGQETELMERYGVSRWIIRQAVRKLEVHAILRSKRGQGGGLTVDTPDPEYTIATAQTYLHATEIGPHPFAELWFNLLITIAQLAARRADPEHMATLRAASEQIQTITFEEYRTGLPRYYVALADVARNEALRILLLIIARYLLNFKVRVSSPTVPERMIALLAEITAAVDAGDEGLARRLMTTYTAIIGGYFTFVTTFTPQSGSGG
ncbi:MAG: FCD domain-containing protein [Sphingomonadaceae bacterium]|nr:FCD domain-containing protein [Sphingomonadaceae bacterium]